MMRQKGGEDWESVLYTEWMDSGCLSTKGALFTLAGLAPNPGGGGGDPRGRQLRNRMGWEHQPTVLGCAGGLGSPRRDSSFWGGREEAGAAGTPRGCIRAASQTSRSHLANKNLFGPPRYCSVYPPSSAHPFPACQAPNSTLQHPHHLANDDRHLARKPAQSTPLRPRNGPQM